MLAPSDVLARLPGLEPGTSGLGGSRSILLSYRRIRFMCAETVHMIFYLLMCDAVKGAFRLRRRAFFRKRRCNRIHRVIFLAYMGESPVKLNRNIRMKEPCVIHGL